MNKETLRNYLCIGKEINLLRLEIERLRSSLQAVPQLSDMPRGGAGEHDRTASTIAKIVDTEMILDGKINEYIIIRQQIEESIKTLPSNLRLLLRLRYIEGYRWEKIAVEMNYAWAQVHRLHGQALQTLHKDDTK